MTLQDLVINQTVWNKEKIQVVTEDKEGKPIHSIIDRIEFLMYDFEDFEIEWFESGTGEYNGNEISIIIFHVSKKEVKE